MRKIDWNKNETNSDQELRWMKSFARKPFSERFAYICKLQQMNIKESVVGQNRKIQLNLTKTREKDFQCDLKKRSINEN